MMIQRRKEHIYLGYQWLAIVIRSCAMQLNLMLKRVILAIPTIEPKDRKDILEICKQTGCRLSILPGLYQLINSEITVSALREVEIEDLLGREPVETNLPSIMSYVKDRVVFVTGEADRSEVRSADRSQRYQPKKLVIIDNYENNAYEIRWN